MSGETIYARPRKHNVAKMRVHDYLYDSAYIVSGARDYARTAFKAAMASAQVGIQPNYSTMFSELRKYPRTRFVYHPNCRLPEHVDRSYGGYLARVQYAGDMPKPELGGKDRFKYSAITCGRGFSCIRLLRRVCLRPSATQLLAHTMLTTWCYHLLILTRMTTAQTTGIPAILAGAPSLLLQIRPKKVMALNCTTPDFHPPTPILIPVVPTKPRSRGTQSVYRESSAQTIPWQPDGKAAKDCATTPEVIFLDKFRWGPGCPFRTGDLPADFHTTEIINKMRHARTWYELVDKGAFPRWMKKNDAIIKDVETRDWLFREAEIDELQGIRLELLHRILAEQGQNQNTRNSQKLAKLWDVKKQEMEKKLEHIRHTRDRELRKLAAIHGGGGRVGQVARMRAARGLGSMTTAATDPTSDLYAPMARHGYQARRRHAEICYDPSLLTLEDHKQCAEPPAWLLSCGQDLLKTCSGHHLPRDTTQLCQRETKWSEEFLEQLHNDLKKARLGAASTATAGPLHVLKPRRLNVTPRPATPEVEAVYDGDEASHQAALLLQRMLRGRAVQNLMYEGRTRAAELTEELKTTHGLQKEDRVRIAREEAKAREYNAMRTEAEQKEDAISALVDELCGGAVSAALDFLEKELRRLKEERRQHAFILMALREKTMREAAEAGRRQKELRRMREHDEMFKQILGVTQESVEAYFKEIMREGVELAAEEAAVKTARAHAADLDDVLHKRAGMSTGEEHETVAELVQQFLLPEAHKQASRKRIAAMQDARAHAARDAIFGVVDKAEIVESKEACVRCGCPLGEICRCRVCPTSYEPVETESRDDPRWKFTRARAYTPRSPEERFPPAHEFRCMLNTLVQEVVEKSREERREHEVVKRDCAEVIRDQMSVAIDTKEIINLMIDRATGAVPPPPVRTPDPRFYLRRVVADALERTEPFKKTPCPDELPSVIRRRREQELAASADQTCRCEEEAPPQRPKVMFGGEVESEPPVKAPLLPSALRVLEEMRRCKCDTDASPSSAGDVDDATTEADTLFTEMTEATEATEVTEATEMTEATELNEETEEN